MSRYLISSTNVYRVPTVEDALKLRDELQEDICGELTNFSYKVKQHKTKGEVDEEWCVATAKFQFNDEKEPWDEVSVKYEKEPFNAEF